MTRRPSRDLPVRTWAVVTAITMATTAVGVREIASRVAAPVQLDGRQTDDPHSALLLAERPDPPAARRPDPVTASTGVATTTGRLPETSPDGVRPEPVGPPPPAGSPTGPSGATSGEATPLGQESNGANGALRPATMVIELVPDRTTVPPGGVITWTLVVTNVGEEDYAGEWLAESHWPAGTHVYFNACAGIDEECYEASYLAQTEALADQHPFSWQHGGGHGPGEARDYSERTRVNPDVEPGTVITNHAHLTLQNGSGEVVHTPTVEVLVVADDR